MAEALFYAVFVGVGLGVLLDFFRLPRLVLRDRFFFDLLFWLISSIVVFCYLLIFNNGSVRVIYLLFILLGFLFFTFTVGRYTKEMHISLAKKIKIRLKSFKKVLQKIYNIYYNIKENWRSIKARRLKGDKNGKGSKEED